jgi:hypothetical protein
LLPFPPCAELRCLDLDDRVSVEPGDVSKGVSSKVYLYEVPKKERGMFLISDAFNLNLTFTTDGESEGLNPVAMAKRTMRFCGP